MEELEKILIHYNMFFINGIKSFIKEYEKDNRRYNLKESLYIKNLYECQKNTSRFIRFKRKEYKEKISLIENNICILSETLKELELERNRRVEIINHYNKIDNKIKESIEDIIDAVAENKKVISLEEEKVKEIKRDYKKFNETSLEEENIVYTFFYHIKKEFIKVKDEIIKILNNDSLTDIEFILTYEGLLMVTHKMICIEEDLLSE